MSKIFGRSARSPIASWEVINVPNATDNSRKTAALQVLEPDEFELARVIDDVFRGWAVSAGASERRYAPLISVTELQRFDYFDNFPHLGLAVAKLNADNVAQLTAAAGPLQSLPLSELQPPTYLLPSAACYAVYLHAENTQQPVEGSLHTLACTCFRNESAYEGLARLLGFTMREIVFIGGNEQSKQHLDTFTARVVELTNTLNIPMEIETATDPFFDKSGSRAKMQQLFPVKREFIIDDIAVGSVNYHRNFFGERCGITLADGQFAHTSCVAFGIERWVHVLTRHFGGAAEATQELRRCAPLT